MADPILLYSTNTWLAWAISNEYYGGRHWVWCSPFFRANGTTASAFPPSAIPGAIYDRLFEDVVRGDRHSAWIAKNRIGLLKGAQLKADAGVISATQKSDIFSVVNAAQIADFKPLLYVIPGARAKALLQQVPPDERAHPMSVEFIIEALDSHEFDALEIRGPTAHV